MEAESDVENLIGEELVWHNDYYLRGEEIHAVVAAIAEGVGITIVRADNTAVELTCLNGPLSPHEAHPDFEASWEYTVKAIKAGYFDVQEERRVQGTADVGCGGGMSACAFG